MKKTLITILALSGMAMADGTTIVSEDLVTISTNQDYIYLDCRDTANPDGNFNLKINGDVTIGTMDGFTMGAVKSLNLDLTEGTLKCTNNFKPGQGTTDEVINLTLGTVSTTSAAKLQGGMISFGGGSTTVNLTANVVQDDILNAASAAGDSLASISLITSPTNGWYTNNAAQNGKMSLTLTGLTDYADGGIWFLKDGTYTLATTVSATAPTTTTDLAATLGTGKYAIVMDSCNANTGMTAMRLVATVPEPATATLSLLALAGLAARRRRH